jgi:hypothetical protein
MFSWSFKKITAQYPLQGLVVKTEDDFSLMPSIVGRRGDHVTGRERLSLVLRIGCPACPWRNQTGLTWI